MVDRGLANSVVQVLGFVFTAVAVVVRSAELVAQRGNWSDVHTFRCDYQALFAIPIVVFGFNCHANVVTIFSCAAPWLLRAAWSIVSSGRPPGKGAVGAKLERALTGQCRSLLRVSMWAAQGAPGSAQADPGGAADAPG